MLASRNIRQLSWTDGEKGGSIQKREAGDTHTHMAIVFPNAWAEANEKMKKRRRRNIQKMEEKESLDKDGRQLEAKR